MKLIAIVLFIGSLVCTPLVAQMSYPKYGGTVDNSPSAQLWREIIVAQESGNETSYASLVQQFNQRFPGRLSLVTSIATNQEIVQSRKQSNLALPVKDERGKKGIDILSPFDALFHVVPPAYTGTPGTATFLGPLANSQRTYQLLIQDSMLTTLVGQQLTALSWRIPPSAATNWPAADVAFTNYDVYLSGSVTPANRSLTSFASNVVGTQTQVRSGGLTVPASSYPSGGSPNGWGPEIVFNTPWLYTGGHLLVEIRHTGFTGTSQGTDAIGTAIPGYGTAFSACWTGNYTGTSGSQGNFTVIRLTGAPSGPSHDIGVNSLARTSANDHPTASSNMDMVEGTGIDLSSSVPITYVAMADTARFRAIVQNYGTFPETTYQVRFTIDGSTISTLNNTRILAVGSRDTFNLVWNTGTPGPHVARAYTLLGTDANPVNDTSSANFTIAGGPTLPGDTLYTFVVSNEIILGVTKMGSANKLVFTSGGQSSAVTTDNKWIVTTMNGTILDATHAQLNPTATGASPGFGFRDLAWDGKWLLTSDDNRIRRVDTTTFTEIATPITFGTAASLHRGLGFERTNKIWKSNFTTEPTIAVDTTGANVRTLGTPPVAPYGIAFDKWTSPNRGYLWYSEPSSSTLPCRLSKIDTTTGAIITSYNYGSFTTGGTSGGLEIINDHPGYPGRVVAIMVIQAFPSSRVIVIDLGPDSSASTPTPGWTARTSGVTSFLQSVKQVNANVIWAAGNGTTVRRSTDGGATWTNGNSTPGIITGDIYNIEALDANTAFVTTSPAATFIYRTTNGGTLWTQVFTQAGGFINAIRMVSPTVGIAEGDPVGGTFTIVGTTDGGATWTRVPPANEPVPVGAETGLNNSLSTVGTTHIWFGSSLGPVWRSTNSGASWTRVATTFTGNNLEVHFNNTTNGVTGNNAGLANRSTDGGATWVATTIPGTGGVNGLSGAGSDFFASKGTVAYRSTNGGATWASSYGGGIGTLSHLDFYASGGNLYGTTISQTGGIATAFFGVTGVRENTQELPTVFSLAQNYPNPFNPSTTIGYTLPEAARVNLSIYNMLGQRVAELTNEVEGAGFYTVVWNGRNQNNAQVATGVYFYRIEATPANGTSPFVRLKKMVLIK